MISQRLAKAFTKFEWIDEYYDPICSIPLTKALCAVVEAVEELSKALAESNANFGKTYNSVQEIFETSQREISARLAIDVALKELERALKECGV